ncbi:MAG: potassium channel protein [Chloroflexi bacterium]|nr:potassium channel protein [Chloroflexota bacterium]MYK61323.1 potassium channel protein [Chloroflexota bacterium]
MPAFVVSAPSESQRLIRRRRWNLARGIMALLTVMAIGVVGFKVIEGDDWTWMDAAYMSVITMSTVGFEEVRPLSELGRVFSIVIIITGVGAFAYTFATLGEQLISGQLVSNLRQRGTEAMMRRLRGHHIVVGYGDTGSVVAGELNALGKERVVVVDADSEKIQNASEDGFVGIHGDGGQDEVLIKAGITRAKSLICTVAPDSAALMTVLSAHVIAPDVEIVAKATLPESEPKLIRAGASKVISMHHIAASRIVDEIVGATKGSGEGLRSIEVEGGVVSVETGEVIVVGGGPYCDVSIGDSTVVSDSKADVVAIKRGDSGELVEATDDVVPRAGDRLILVGTPEHVEDAVQALVRAQG